MKSLNLKIKTCQDCPFSTLTGIDWTCKKSNYRVLCSFYENFDGHLKTIIPDWCPLKDSREQGVKVGVSVFIFNENREILVGHRTPDNLWGLPGGGMIAGETPKESSAREVEEETGIIIDPQKLSFATFTNDVFLKERNEHWITLYFICNHSDWTGNPERKEPKKCLEWKWFNMGNLPPNLFCDWGKFIPELKKMIEKPDN